MSFHTHTFQGKKRKQIRKYIFLGEKKKKTQTKPDHPYLGHVGSVPDNMCYLKTYTMPSSLRFLQNKPLIYLHCKLFGA